MKNVSKTLHNLNNVSKFKREQVYTYLYNDYRENFKTLTRFAEYYNIDKSVAMAVIDAGKAHIDVLDSTEQTCKGCKHLQVDDDGSMYCCQVQDWCKNVYKECVSTN